MEHIEKLLFQTFSTVFFCLALSIFILQLYQMERVIEQVAQRNNSTILHQNNLGSNVNESMN